MSSPSTISKNLLYFHYEPINIAPEIFAGLFAIIAVVFIHRIRKSQSGKWLYILPGTAVAELIGYAFRMACIYNPSLGNYVGMNLLLLVSPNALALVNYKTLGKIIAAKSHGQDTKKNQFWLRPKFVTWFFFWSDFIAFFLQCSGGGMQVSESLRTIGQVITLIGLAAQLFFFAAFTAIAIYVHKSHQYDYQLLSSHHLQPKRQVMTCLFVTNVLLYIRSIYRVAEYATGYDGPVAMAEWAFYVFDSAIIVAFYIVYYIWFVGDYLPNVEDTRDETSHVPLSVIHKV
ncbi:RTA1 like protein-domain-containing protein [Chlamydoabsidia padenii]|nr:RTA1 like protein-domain-containing protein [Chlamydoabsidia padenii]